MKPRKYSFPTRIPFTVALLREAAARVCELGLSQVQFTCETEPGLQAMIYGSGRIVFHSRYSLQHRPHRDRVGELGLISIEQAKQQHRANRLLAAQGRSPRQPASEPVRFKQLFWDHYVTQCRSRGKKTLHTDISRHVNWVARELDDLAVTSINKSHVHRLVVKMMEANLAPATIRTTLGQVRTIFELAVDLEIINRNPTKGVRTPRVNNRRDTFLTAEQVRAFVVAAQNDPNVPGCRMLTLMALTGARLGEATRYCRWDLVDLDAGVWHLPDQKSGRPGQIHLSTAAKALIRSMSTYRRNAFVFPGQHGEAPLGRPIRLFKRLCRAAGIPDGFRIHDLRHAWISAGVNAGIPLEIMSQGARHSSPVVTRLYSHAHMENLTAANERIANLFMPPNAA